MESFLSLRKGAILLLVLQNACTAMLDSDRGDTLVDTSQPSRNWQWKSMNVYGHPWDFMVKNMDFHGQTCLWKMLRFNDVKVHRLPCESIIGHQWQWAIRLGGCLNGWPFWEFRIECHLCPFPIDGSFGSISLLICSYIYTNGRQCTYCYMQILDHITENQLCSP